MRPSPRALSDHHRIIGRRRDRDKGRRARIGLEVLEERRLLDAASDLSLTAGYGDRPLGFEVNQGQTDARAKYLTRGDGYSLFLTQTGAVLSLLPTGGSANGAVVSISAVGGNASPTIQGLNRAAGVSNYIRGNDPSDWKTNIPTYGQVAYRNVYAGIDMVYKGTGKQLEYDFQVAAGANPSMIRLSFDGTLSKSIDAQGNLVLHTLAGDLTEHAPVIYQDYGGVRHAVSGSYLLNSDGTVGFTVGAHDTSKALTIDPIVTYSTFLGDSATQLGSEAATSINAVTVDSDRNVYVTGSTSSERFPIVGDDVAQSSFNGYGHDAFVAKFDPDGQLIFSTFLGGEPQEDNVHVDNSGGFPQRFGYETADTSALAIALDAENNIYLTGTTSEVTLGDIDRTIGIPTINAFQTHYGGDSGPTSQYANNSDAFVMKLLASGARLEYSSYLGTRFRDVGTGISVDQAGNAYVVGTFGVSAFALFDSVAFLVKVKTNGTLVYKKTLGSDRGTTVANAIAADDQGNLYVAGDTNDGDVGTATYGPLGDDDAFVAKYTPDGTVAQVARLGGSKSESANAIAVFDGSVYITGGTLSKDLPTTPGALLIAKDYPVYIPTAFVAKLDGDLTQLVFSTYLGGSTSVSYFDETPNKPAFIDDIRGDVGLGIAVDPFGAVYVVGSTASSDFILRNPIQSEHSATFPYRRGDPVANTDPGGYDAFVTRISADGTSLAFSTYLGASLNDEANAVTTDSFGNVYVVGYTESVDFPTTENAYQPTYSRRIGHSSDFGLPLSSGFIVRLARSPTLIARPVQATIDELFSGDVAGLASPFPDSEPADFDITIRWGDGGETEGTARPGFGSGTFKISGEYTYHSLGAFPVVVTVIDKKHGLTATTSSLVIDRGAEQDNPSIAIDPNDPNHLFVSVSSTSADPRVGIQFLGKSTNGGATWTTRSSVPDLPEGGTISRVAVDRYGNLFVAYLTNGSDSHIVLATSSDQGKTFRLLYEGTEAATDFGLAVGIGLHGEMGSVWIASEVDGGFFIQGFSVTGLGQVSSVKNQYAIVSATGDPKLYLGDLVIGPKGQVLLSYQKPVGDANSPNAASQIFVRSMPDGLDGMTVTPETFVTDSQVGISYHILAQDNFRISASPRLAWNQGAGRFPNRIYLVYTDVFAAGTSDTNIFVRVSNDNGATWSDPVRMNDDNETASQFLPSLAIDQSTGDLAVSWYDTRLDPNGHAATYWMTVFDGRGGRSHNVQVSPFASDMTTTDLDDLTSTYQFGAFSGIAFAKGVAHPVWIDNSPELSGSSSKYGSLASASIAVAHVSLPPPVVTGIPVTLKEGESFSGTIATFTYARQAPSTDFTAKIDWGDGKGLTDGVITFSGGTPPTYIVRGVQPHTYDGAGDYIIKVIVTLDSTGDMATTYSNVSRRTGEQVGGTIVVDPNNSKHLFSIWQDEDTVRGGSSTDGGLTWSYFDFGGGAEDPLALTAQAAAFDRFGNLFVTFIRPQSRTLIVGLSVDGGASFRPLTSFVTLAPSYGGTRIATGAGLNPGEGSVWITYMRSGRIAAVGASVTGLGAVGGFSAEQVVATPLITTAVRLADAVVGPDGQLAVVFQDKASEAGPSTVYLTVDADGLGNGGFAAPALITTSNVGGLTTIPAQDNQGIDVGARLAWDTTKGGRRGRLYLVYTDSPSSGSADTNVFARYTDDAGAHWSDPVRVNRDAGPASQFLPSLAIDPSTGDLGVGWYDTRKDPDGKQTEFYAAVSADGGQTFSLESVLGLGSSTPANPNLSDAGQANQFLRRSSLGFSGGRLYAVWSDNSSQLDHVTDQPEFEVAIGRPAIAHVAPVPLIAQPLDISNDVGNEGESFTADLATFSQAGTPVDSTRYTATIDWGDGTVPAFPGDPAFVGTIRVEGDHYVVKGTHAYARFGTYTITVKITPKARNPVPVTLTAEIEDAPLDATSLTIHPAPNVPYEGPVATFKDENPAGKIDDLTATIHWGAGGPNLVDAGKIIYDGTASLAFTSQFGIVTIGYFSAGGAAPELYLLALPTYAAGQPAPLLHLNGDYRGGLAQGVDGTLYAIRNNDAGESFLDLLDVTNQTTKQVAYLGTGFTGGLTYDAADGNFYAISQVAGQATLNAIHLSDWSVHAVGSLGAGYFTGLAYSSPNTFYTIVNTSKGASLLDRIDLTSGAATPTPLFGLGDGFTGGLALTVHYVGVNDPLNVLGKLVAVSGPGNGSANLNVIDLNGAAVLPAEPIGPDFTRGFAIVGVNPHIYTATGHVPINVVLTSKGGSAANPQSTAEVGFEPAISQQSFPTTVFQGFSSGPLSLGAFKVPHGASTVPGAYTARINWGDGSAPEDGLVTVSGSTIIVSTSGHTYNGTGVPVIGLKTGAYYATVTLLDSTGNTSTLTATVYVAPDVSNRATAVNIGGPVNPSTSSFYDVGYLFNQSSLPITGPLYVVIEGLPAGVTLDNAEGTLFSGEPYRLLNVPSLGAFQKSQTVLLKFKDPSLAPFSYSIRVIDGPPGDPTPTNAVSHSNAGAGFIANTGQASSDVRFTSQGAGYALGLTATGATLNLASSAADGPSASIALNWLGANPSAASTGLDRLSGLYNSMVGNDRSRWVTNASAYARVRYQGFYNGIDLEYHGDASRSLEYDFNVNPGADPGKIRLSISGASVSLDAAGNLVIHTAAGDVVEKAPTMYQMFNGSRLAVAGGYEIHADGSVGFRVGHYDTSKPLTIDPVLVYSTYLGGSGGIDQGQAVTIDHDGNTYVTGYTQSADFPTLGAIGPRPGAVSQNGTGAGRVAFVTKFDPTGQIVYSTYLGGSGSYGGVLGGYIGDEGRGIAVDAAGEVYLVGATGSFDFPTVNALEPTRQFFDAGFLTKLDASGSNLLFSTYVTGSPVGLALDPSGNIIIAGSGDQIQTTPGAFSSTYSSSYLMKLTPAADRVLFATYLPGSEYILDTNGPFTAHGTGTVSGVAVDPSGAIYVTGRTSQEHVPGVNAAQAGYGGGSSDAFVGKINSTGTSLLYWSYLGGSDDDSGNAIAVDATGHAYVVGTTFSTDFATTLGAFQRTHGAGTGDSGSDVFVVKMSVDGKSLTYSTYLGSRDADRGNGIAVDAAGNAYITGQAGAADFPLVTPFQAQFGGGDTELFHGLGDAFLARLNPTGTALGFSTFIGGSGVDLGNAVAATDNGKAVVTGFTGSVDLPTVNAAQDGPGFTPNPYFDIGNAFVTRIDTQGQGNLNVSNVPFAPSLGTPFQGVVATFSSTATSTTGDYSATINWGDGTTSVGTIVSASVDGFEFNVRGSHTYTSIGTFHVSVTVRDADGRAAGATATTQAQSQGGPVIYRVEVDTSALSGTNGFLDLQLNPASLPGSQGAHASIRLVDRGGGTLGAVASTNGAASGSFGSAVSLTNSSMANLLRQAFKFGSHLIFEIQLDGEALAAPTRGLFGSTFALTLLGSDSTPLASASSLDGATVRVGIDPAGATLYSGELTATGQATFTVKVADAPIQAVLVPFQTVEGTPFTGAVASFTSGNLNALAANFSATIDWGDGSLHSTGTIVSDGGGHFHVDGTHTFVEAGSYSIRVVIASSGGSTAQATSAPTTTQITGLQAPTVAFTGRPLGVATADFNGDGKADLAIWNITSNDVPHPIELDILLGNGDGSFQSSHTVLNDAGSDYRVTIAVADFNVDGKADLLTRGKVLLGNGDGSFHAGAAVADTTDADALIAADFNADGKADLVVGGSYFAGGSRLRLGNGDGTFAAAADISGLPTSAAGDVNADGKMDLVGANGSATYVLLGHGDGTFGTAIVSTVGTAPIAASVGDFDGDGKLDLVAYDAGGTPGHTALLGMGVAILKGKGDGTFEAPVMFATRIFTSVVDLTVGDFNHDNHLDVALAADAVVSLFLGKGDGSLIVGPSNAMGSNLNWSVATGDFDGDGATDVATVGLSSGLGVEVYRGNKDGSFHSGHIFQTASGNILSGDLDGDGKSDIVNDNQVYLGNGDGTYRPGASIGFSGFALTLTDLDGDGKLDLITIPPNNFHDGSINLFLGNGDGTFKAGPSVSFASPVSSATVVDLNGDHKADIVVVTQDQFAVLLGDGDGTFQAPVVTAPTGTFGISSLTSGDYNRDGKADLMLGIAGPAGLSLFLGKGDGTFQAPLRINAGVATFLSTADFNHDSKLDLLAIINYKIQVFAGKGDGTFLDPAETGSVDLDVRFSVADFNGDGELDLFAAGEDGIGLQFFKGVGNGTFGPVQAYVPVTTYNGNIRSLAFADVNGDGRTDLLVGNQEINFGGSFIDKATISVLLSTPNGSFETGRSVGAIGVRAVETADLNGDGRADLIGYTELGPNTANKIVVSLSTPDGFADLVSYDVRRSYDKTATDFVGLLPAVADFNGDGILDMVVEAQIDSPLFGVSFVRVVMTGKGDGTFGDPNILTIPFSSLGIVKAADANGDGLVDLIVLQNGSHIGVSLGKGDGTFRPQVNTPLADIDVVQSQYSVGFTVGDFNGDGLTDTAVARKDSRIDIYLSKGDGSFQAPVTLDYNTLSAAFAAADIDGDGTLDLVVSNINGSVALFKGLGNGAFAPAKVYLADSVYEATFFPNGSLAIADVNGDGTPDVVSGGTNRIAVVLNMRGGISGPNVLDAPLSSTGVDHRASPGVAFRGIVAHLTDANPFGTLDQYRGTIDWGDSSSSAATFEADPAGGFFVIGEHTYAAIGTYNAAVALRDRGGSAANATSHFNVTAGASGTVIATGRSFGATAHLPFTGVVASFTATDASSVASDFLARITWGDGSTSIGQVRVASGGFEIVGTHTYSQAGSNNLSVTIMGDRGESASATGVATVVDTSNTRLTPTPVTFHVTQPSPFSGVVARFVDSVLTSRASDFTAAISWGDGRITNGTVRAVASSPGYFEVVGDHVYDAPGEYPVDVVILGPADSVARVRSTGDVDAPPLTGISLQLTVAEGVAFQGVAASFIDADPFAAAADFTANIDWGDGHTTTGTVTADPDVIGKFNISGGHVYSPGGSFAVVAHLERHVGTGVDVPSAMTVTAAPLAATGATLHADPGVEFTKAVATFTDASTTATTASFKAFIGWGDGTTTLGTVNANGAGKWVVNGTHAFAVSGNYLVKVSILGPGAVSATAVGAVQVSAPTVTGTAGPVQAVEGTPFTGHIVSFDRTPAQRVSDLVASVDWGDGQTSLGTIVADLQHPGHYDVYAANTYYSPGSRGVTITISDRTGVLATLTTHATVANAAITTAPVTIDATKGVSFTGVVATFVDANPFGVTADYTATINLDGVTFNGLIQKDPNVPGGFRVIATFTPTTAGVVPLTVVIQDNAGATAQADSTVNVNASPTLAVRSFNATAGVPFSTTVATIPLGYPLNSPGDFTATIDWGDGHTSSGLVTIDPTSPGRLLVVGGTTYASSGDHPIRVDVVRTGGLRLSGTGVVHTAAAAPLPIAPVIGLPVQGEQFESITTVTAAFFSPDSTLHSDDFAATINWGDGTSSTGRVVDDPKADGQFLVVGTHRYTLNGTFDVTVTISNNQGAHAGTLERASIVAKASTLTLGLTPPSPVQGHPLSEITVGSFSDTATTTATGDYGVIVSWGDGEVSSVSAGNVHVRADAAHPGKFLIIATKPHAYAKAASGLAFRVTVTRNDGGSATKTTSIAVAAAPSKPPQHPAQANADHYETGRGKRLVVPASVGVLANDSNPSAPRSVRLLSAPLHGRLQLNPDGSFTYIPRFSYRGVDSFTYVARISGTDLAPTTVTIAVGLAARSLLLQQHTFVVTGTASAIVPVRFDWTSRQATYNNEVGIVRVDDQAGRIDGVLPGDPTYIRTALSSSRWQTVFPKGQAVPGFKSIDFHGGDRFMVFIVPDETTRAVVDSLGSKRQPIPLYFMNRAANPDRFNHVRIRSNAGLYRMAWEDMPRGGDRDFNDVVLTVRAGR